MASSKVMVSTSPANSDLPRQSSMHSFTLNDFQADPTSRSFGSMNMDELLKNIYADSDSFPSDNCVPAAAGGSSTDSAANGGALSMPKTVDEVWKEIVAGSGGATRGEVEMTLEDFLTKAGAVREEDVKVPVMPLPAPSGYEVEPMIDTVQFQASVHKQSGHNGPGGFGVEPVGFGNGIDGRMVVVGDTGVSGGTGGIGRGKRRVVEAPLDRVTQQKQRRMIKNRESAARSRERKQAYTVELESLVTQLEKENARLLREEAEQTKERYNQLMENLIPVVEKRRPPRVIRRVNSMCW